MRYIDRGYFNSWQVDPNGIWQYLDCIQKIAYFQFQNSTLDMESVFCDDINIVISENEDEILIKRNCLKSNDQYFDMKWNRNLDKPEEFIREQIDKGVIVGLNTYFYDIPNFNWYHNGEDRTSKHSCLIVGYVP